MVLEINDGIWSFTSGSITGYIYAQNNGKKECFVSLASDYLPFTAAVTFTPVSAPGVKTKAQFLNWACNQLGGGILNEYDLTVAYAQSTYTCPSSVSKG